MNREQLSRFMAAAPVRDSDPEFVREKLIAALESMEDGLVSQMAFASTPCGPGFGVGSCRQSASFPGNVGGVSDCMIERSCWNCLRQKCEALQRDLSIELPVPMSPIPNRLPAASQTFLQNIPATHRSCSRVENFNRCAIL
jgi:hypothetical protein